MKLSKITVAVVAALGVGLGAGMASTAFALDLYVDKKTKQIFTEAGPNREKIGSFTKVEDAPAETAVKVDTTDPTQPRRDRAAAMREKAASARLINDVAVLQERVKETESVHMKFDDRGLHFESKDGNFSMSWNGRLQAASQYNFINDLDPAKFSTADPTQTPSELNSGMNIRRARLGAEGTFMKILDYKFEFDFSRGNGSVGSGITDAYVRLNQNNALSYKLGSFKEPFSLEEAASNRYLTFIERHMAVNAFVDNPNTYKTGIGANYAVPRWQTGIALMTEPIGAWSAASTSVNANGNQSRNNGSGDSGWEAIGRISGRPWMQDETHFLHAGISAGHTAVNNQYTTSGTQVGAGSAGGGGGMAFFAFPDTNVDRTNMLNTGNLTHGNAGAANQVRVDSYDRYAGELWLTHGPWSAQGEYLRTNVNGLGYSGEHLTGAYGFVSYFLTGESKAYHVRNGAANRIRPRQPFGWTKNSGWGAWEIAAGYDWINMNNGIIKGGEADLVRMGLNWYPHSNVKWQANIVHMLDIKTSGTPTTCSPSGNGYSSSASNGGCNAARTHSFDGGAISSFMTQLQVDF
jgi:phosphate-selective porin OprO/OprP